MKIFVGVIHLYKIVVFGTCIAFCKDNCFRNFSGHVNKRYNNTLQNRPDTCSGNIFLAVTVLFCNAFDASANCN